MTIRDSILRMGLTPDKTGLKMLCPVCGKARNVLIGPTGKERCLKCADKEP
jgi:uncharacterized protein (DUF983 family)